MKRRRETEELELTAVCSISPDLIIQDTNDVFNSTFRNLSNTNFVSNLCETEREGVEHLLLDTFAERGGAQFECRGRAKLSGCDSIYMTSWNAFYYQGRVTLKGKVVQSDLFELLRESEFYNFVNHLPSLVNCVDMDGNILWTNLTELTFLGYSKEEFVGRNITDFFIENPNEIGLIEKFKQYESIQGHRAKVQTKNGGLRSVQIHYNMYRTEASKLFARCITEDISDIIEREKEFDRAIFMRQQAEISSRQKSKFIAKVSHEIRNPLNCILGLSEQLLSLELPNDQRELVRHVLTNSQSLRILVDDLLETAKMDSSQLRLQFSPFKPVELLQFMKVTFQKHAVEKGISFEAEISNDVPQTLKGDSIRLQQIISNLIHNSLKFTTEGFIKIQVGGESIDTENWQLDISVEDSGCGITLEDQEKLFTEFFSSEQSLIMGGTGLGLIVCKNLVNLMGGYINFNSEPGKGSKFWFSISMPIINEGKLQLQPVQVFKQESKILVVDDCPVNLKVMIYYLQQTGCSAEIACDGEEAICMIEKNHYGIVFMDVQMPVMGGIEATKAIRKKGFEVPIVALSAGVTEPEKQACRDSGMNNFLSKPVQRKDITSILIAHSVIKEY